MKSDIPDASFIKLLIKKVKNPLYIIIILVLYILNYYIKIVKTTEIALAICVFLVCVVLLKDTIYKCLDRWCKRDETIEKEKTKRLLAKDNDKNEEEPSPDNKNDSSAGNRKSNIQNNDGDVKVYDIKHRKRS